MDVNWAEINDKLPTEDTSYDEARRKMMFAEFDINGNGVLSLAEVDKSIRDVLKIDQLWDAKLAIITAFNIAKKSQKSDREDGDRTVDAKEFRFFLSSLKQYFQYWVMFCKVDANSDKRINLEEFLAAKAKIEEWIPGTIEDWEGTFKSIDKNGTGLVLFDEFADWAISKNLEMQTATFMIGGMHCLF